MMHIGAAVGALFARGGPPGTMLDTLLRPLKNDRDRRELVTIGAAAGVAAAFMAPIGGILF